MTLEQRQLVLLDISARLPHGVYVHFCNTNIDEKLTEISLGETITQIRHNGKGNQGLILPYLRPLSSMNEDEKEELKQYLDAKELDCNGFGYIEGGTLENYVSNIPYSICSYVIDWLNAHHFDYRGLIEKGLALEAPKGMYDRN